LDNLDAALINDETQINVLRISSTFFFKIKYINLNYDLLTFTFYRLAEKYGLQLVARERFAGYFEKVKEEGRSLLGKMQALEVSVHDTFSFLFTSVIYIHLKRCRI
jgi:hypothetical protein